MVKQVLILGGSGRIGCKVAADLLTHTSVNVTITGRNLKTGQLRSHELGERCRFVAIDLDNWQSLQAAISQSDLVIHCAGPEETGSLDTRASIINSDV